MRALRGAALVAAYVLVFFLVPKRFALERALAGAALSVLAWREVVEAQGR